MSKKDAKQEKKERKEKANKASESDQDSSQQVADLFDKPVKEKNDKGEEFWSLTRNKRVSVSEFKGKPMVNLREYFEKDGEWFPTKKGISLTKESWDSFKKLISDIDKAMANSK